MHAATAIPVLLNTNHVCEVYQDGQLLLGRSFPGDSLTLDEAYDATFKWLENEEFYGCEIKATTYENY